MAKQENSLVSDSGIDTVLSDDVNFKGTLKFNTSLKVKGKLEGEIQSKDGKLIIGENAEVKAKILANKVSNLGHVIGNIDARDSLEIFSGAKVEGDIATTDLIIERGALLNGQCKMKSQI